MNLNISEWKLFVIELVYRTGFITQLMQVAFSKGTAIVAGIPVILHPFWTKNGFVKNH